MTSSVLGVAGLGRMGAPMAGRLVAAGYEVFGYDPAGTSERLPAGANAVESIEQMATATDMLLLSVPDGEASLEICSRVVEISGRRAKTIVDLSTIGISAARQCHETLSSAGIDYVDAPVSGGVAGARNGTLAIMVGASLEVFERVEPVIGVLGKKLFRVGDEPGQGQAMKLLNNYVSASMLAATSEATVFGARMGLDLATMVDVLNASSGRSNASEEKFPTSVIPGTYDFGFATALMTKDIGLYLSNAEDAGVPRELAETIVALWKRFHRDHPDSDFTFIHRYLSEREK